MNKYAYRIYVIFAHLALIMTGISYICGNIPELILFSVICIFSKISSVEFKLKGGIENAKQRTHDKII